MTCPSVAPPARLRVADDRNPAVPRFHRDFPGWRVYGRGTTWCAMRPGGHDGLVGVSAASLTELRTLLTEALEAAS